jgi:hypothetical protein
MSDIVVVSRDVGRRAENFIGAGSAATTLKGVELLLHENVYVMGAELKVGANQIDCSTLLKKGLNTLQSMPFDLLGIDLACGTVDVRKAYKKLALKYHPDKNPKTTPLFQLIQNIQSKLSNSEERQKEVIQAQNSARGPSNRSNPQPKPNAPPPKPNQPFQPQQQNASNGNYYNHYYQHYQQFQQQQPQQQQQQPPYTNVNGNNAYSNYNQYAAGKKNYYEDLLKEQYRKAAEAEKRAKDFANKFQEENVFPGYSQKSNTNNNPSAAAHQSAQQPQTKYESYRPNPTGASSSTNTTNQKPSAQASSSSSSSSSANVNGNGLGAAAGLYQQYAARFSNNAAADSSNNTSSNNTSSNPSAGEKYTTGQTYRTTSDGKVYPQQQQNNNYNNYNSNLPKVDENSTKDSARGKNPNNYNQFYSNNTESSKHVPSNNNNNVNNTSSSNNSNSNATNSTSSIPKAAEAPSKPVVIIPRPFGFRLVSKASTVVELEWKTSSLHHCPLAVELSWKDHSKAVKTWEMSSKLIHSGCCRKKNLTPVTTYEFRVRAIEELKNGQLGNKSEWTESIVVLLPGSTETKTASNAAEIPKTSNNANNVSSHKIHTNSSSSASELPKPTAPPAASRPSSSSAVNRNSNSNRSSQENLASSDNSKPTISIPTEKTTPGKKSSSKNVNSPLRRNGSNFLSPNGYTETPQKYRRFNSKIGVASMNEEPDRKNSKQNVHYMEKEQKSVNKVQEMDIEVDEDVADDEDEDKQPKAKGNLSRFGSPPAFLSASAKLAWGKETLGKESAQSNHKNPFDISNDNDNDVTYMEVDEEIDMSHSNDHTDLKKKEQSQNNKKKNQEEADEVDDDESLQKNLKNVKINKAHDNYHDDFEIEESTNLDRSKDSHDRKSKDQKNIKKNLHHKLSLEAEEIESEYTDSDTSSGGKQTHNPQNAHHRRNNDHQQHKQTAATANTGDENKSKPPKHHNPTQSNNPKQEDHLRHSKDAYASEGENLDDLEEEKLFLLYPPKDKKKRESSDDESSILSKQRIYRHPVHKEPFMKSEVKGYLVDDQNVIGCATCGDWLRVKMHISAKNNAKVSASQEEWGWCLRRDKTHTYLKLLEGRRGSISISNSKVNSTTNSRAPSATKREQKPPPTAASNPSFASPPAESMKEREKGLKKNNVNSKSFLGKSLRDIPKPFPTHQQANKHEPSSQAPPSASNTSNTNNSKPRRKDVTSIEEWIECFDEQGNVYYFNEKTSESRWEPPEWFEDSDPTTGAKYYVHVVMKDSDIEFHSTWTKPKQFARIIHLTT